MGHAECVVELRGLVRQILQPLGPPVFDPAGAGFGGLVEKVHRFALRPEKFADRAELGLLIAELALEFDDSSLLLLLLPILVAPFGHLLEGLAHLFHLLLHLFLLQEHLASHRFLV